MYKISEEMIRQHSSERSFVRGQVYYAAGAVHDCTGQDNTLQAVVEGTESYQVVITLGETDIESSQCTCPYDLGGYCKHEVAVMLTYSHQPEAFKAQSPKASNSLEDLSAEDLRHLLRTLLNQKPELNDWFQVMLSGLPTRNSQADVTERIGVDTSAYRRQIQRAVNQVDYNRHWQTIWDAVHALEEAHAQACTFLESGDYANALALMRILGAEVIPDYGNIEEECQLADFLESWIDDLTEAILGANLSEDEREELGQVLTEWAGELSDYGLDETLDTAITACVRGWDAPPDGVNDVFGSNLTYAQLNILDQRGDVDAYLKLSLERGMHYLYARRLVELGQTEQALEYALQHLTSAGDCFQLGQLLQQQGHIEAAYTIGMKSLNCAGRKYEAGSWIAELAETLGRKNAAQQAWQTVFDDSPNLNAYRNLKRLSGENWHDLRPRLLVRLQDNQHELIKVLIEEQEVEEAIRVWDSYPYWGYQMLGDMVDATGTSHPNWATQKALEEALSLINKGSKYYPHAVSWLDKVKAIYLQHDRERDWKNCIADIRAKHGRKYSLMGQLERL